MKSLLLIAVILALVLQVNCKVNLKHIKSVGNVKDFKRILKTHTNVMVIYSKEDKAALDLLRWVEDVAKEMKGKGTILYINCGEDKDSKKLCKKFSVNPKPKALKHYKDGKFNKDYDRKDTQKSMLAFMQDPTGDAPWEEDPTAKNVVQINTEKELNKLRRKEKGPMLIMFYAPWCGYCKKLKPDYAAAANELLGKAVLVGMDVDKPDAFNVRYQFNITGFPTIIYFDNGEQKFNYAGKMSKEGIIEWLADPTPAEEAKVEEDPWSDTAPEILHLDDGTFDNALKENPSMVVMFYAPWCGHCKTMKPEYVDAAKQMTEEEIDGKLAAVDCTKSTAVCKKFGVSGYPTVKYFADAEYKFKLNVRKKDKIVEFMKNPEEPPAPPPEDLPWSEVSGPEILHLTDETFKEVLKKKKHVLVMFYAPWCGHCKNAKPEYEKASEHYKDNRKVWYAGVDCTIQKKTCEQFDVKGFPTFRYFLYGKKDFAYNGGRTSESFISFMEDPKEKEEEPEVKEPEWKDTPSAVVHLGNYDFDDFLKFHESLLVMFYAPWCGHCKAMKPAYTEAADELLGSDHAIAAVDCTKHQKICGRYDVKGYPTLKYFKSAEPTEYTSGRDKDSIVAFLNGRSGNSGKKPLSGWAAEGNFVDHLDSDTFAEYIKNNAAVLIMFYAPWCGHCKNMKPAFADAANIFNHEKRLPGAIAAVDCTANTGVCSEYKIDGYPTLLYFKNGKKDAEYNGGRETEDFVNFLQTGPQPEEEKPVEKNWDDEGTDVIFLGVDTFDDFVKKEKCVFVMFYTSWCGHCKNTKPAFAEAATMINVENKVPGCKLAAVDCEKSTNVCKDKMVTGYPTLKYFKDGKDDIKYKGARSAQAIVQFLKNPVDDAEKPQEGWEDEASDVVHLTSENFEEFTKDKDVFIVFYAPWCGHCKTIKPDFMKLATKLKEEESSVVVAAVEATTNRDLAKREKVQGYPTLKYYRNGNSVADFEEMRTFENMYSFVQKQFTGKDDGPERWETIPSSVVHLKKETFQDYLKQNKHVLVTFHVPWCQFCQEIKPDMMKLASRLSEHKGIFGIAAFTCDEDKEFCTEQGIKYFPTTKYFMNGEFVTEYSDDVDDMIEFFMKKEPQLKKQKEKKDEL